MRRLCIFVLMVLTLMVMINSFAFATDVTESSQENTDGFGNDNNSATYALETFDNHLYAGTWNASGTEIWRTPDGTTWSQANTDGFGTVNNMITSALETFDGYLYAGTMPATAIWRTSDGTTWSQANTDGFGDAGNRSTAALETFDSYLYARTYNRSNGTAIWRIEWETQPDTAQPSTPQTTATELPYTGSEDTTETTTSTTPSGISLFAIAGLMLVVSGLRMKMSRI